MSLYDRLGSLRESGYPPEAAERLLALVWRNPSVDHGSDVLDELLPELPSTSVDRLIASFLRPFSESASPLNDYPYSSDGGDYVIARLYELGFAVVDGPNGWSITLQDGRTITAQYRGIREVDQTGMLASRDAAIARLGLRAMMMSRVPPKGS